MKTLFTPDKDEERSWCHLSSLLPRGQQPQGVVGLRLDNGSIRPGIIWRICHFRWRLRRGFQQPLTIAFHQLATLWKSSAAYSSPSLSLQRIGFLGASLLYPKTTLLSNHLPVIEFCDIIRRLRDGRANLSLYAVNWQQATKIPILEESVLLNQAKYIYELTPLGALALRPLCKTPSPALTILEVDPFANSVQFAIFLNQKMEEQ